MTVIKRGDTPTLRWQLSADGQPVDLTAWTCLLMVRKRGVSTLAINAEATGDAEGVVTYTLEADELETGDYQVEIQTTNGGTILTYPDDGFEYLKVTTDLGPPAP